MLSQNSIVIVIFSKHCDCPDAAAFMATLAQTNKWTGSDEQWSCSNVSMGFDCLFSMIESGPEETRTQKNKLRV